MESHLETGRFGEKIAYQLLEDLGYSILERNWRFGSKEIDLIATDQRDLIVVEVKTRSAGSYQKAALCVSQQKRRHLITAADHYVRSHGLQMGVRYDIIGIDIAKDGTYTVEHIPRAFYPTLALRPAPRGSRLRRMRGR